MKKNIFIILIILLITSGCGFKVVNQSKLINYSISEIKTTGDKRINYKLKNKLSSSFKNNKNIKVNLFLNTKKNKKSKEKNIQNKITKYEITIIVKAELKDINSNNLRNLTITESGDFLVANQHSQTLENEKKLISLLTDKLVGKIIQRLSNNINDI
jgi:outer membrane lipopolysaccharide assembly protein LptE/RlpB|tara:strand:- start:1207 stop:1677 length:471 start_codon:yes stop_codon:yes gene_type:complete